MIGRVWERRDPIALALIGLVVLYVGAVGTLYWLYTLSLVGIYAIVAVGFNAVLGQAGQVTFAQVAFMAVGAYGSAILTTKAHWNSALALVASVILGGFLSLVVNLPFLRLRGHYLGMATLAFALGIESFAANADALTGGRIGLPNIPPLRVGGFVVNSQPNFFIVVWVLCGLCVAVYVLTVRSHIGRSWRALAARPDVAASLGISVPRRRLLALVMAGSMAALSGSLLAEFQNYAAPDFFDIVMIGNIFFIIIVGGMATTSGPLLGAFIIVLLPDQLNDLGQWKGVTVLLLLLAALVLLPTGILGDPSAVGGIRTLLPAVLQGRRGSAGAS